MSMLRPGQDGRIGHRVRYMEWGLLVALLTIAAPVVALAQRPNRPVQFYPDDSDTADALLRNAASHAREGQWAEAVEIEQRVIEQYGEKVVKLNKDDPAADPTGESVLFVDLRRFCQRRLAALPPEARAIYRRRVDSQAERWFQEGTKQRDRSLLRRVVEETFCSSRGDDAADLLGDLAFQDGRFGEALLMYRRLVPDRPDDRSGLVHPDPSVDLARVAAKKLLCRAALGENPPDNAALDAYAKAYPDVAGTLAGRTGPYLQSLKQALASDRLAPPAQPDSRWPTFAGSPTRTKVVPGSIDVGSQQWQVDLMPISPDRKFPPSRRMGGFASTPIPTDRLLGYHPIVLRDQVIVCDETRVVAYNLNDRPASASSTIKEVWRHDADPEASTPQAARAYANVPRYTLTAFGDRIYVRLGPTVVPYFGMGRMGMGMGMGGAQAGASQSAIVALDRSAEGKSLWRRSAAEISFPGRPEGTNRNAGFEGTPVADARSVYVAMTDRREQTTTYVVCLDAETGATRWVRYVGAASSDAENIMGFGMGMGFGPGYPSELGHRLLSLDGPTLFYQTNLGAVVSLDAETGAIRWVVTYPRIERTDGQSRERDLNPAIVHEGLVIAAPDDSSSVYAFHAGTGRLVWKTDPLPDDVKLAHLLGVAKGRLIGTGDRVVLFDVKTGKRVSIWPDGPKGYEGFGRGLLAGDKIYWPTRTEIHILDQATGLRTDPPIKLQESFQTSGGNLAVGDGYLIIAQTDKLVVFCQNSRLIQRYRDEIAAAPEQASSHFRLARAAEATGQEELALTSLARALDLARPSETIDGFPLTDLARDHQYRLLVKLGKKSEQENDWESAERRFEAASTVARSDRDRLSARLVLSEVQLARGAPGRAVATLQRLLLDDRLRALNVDAEDGHRMIRSDLLITDRLAAILRRHDRSLYTAFDREARALLERGRLEKDPRLLEEVSRSYPVAEVVPESLLALGQLNEAAQRPGEAAHAYKRLLACAPNDTRRAQALWGLAHAYEAQRLWVPARDTYLEALWRFPDARLEEFGTEARVASLVNERLAQEPFDRMMSDRSEPIVPVPLVRRWSLSVEGSIHPLSAEGVPPSAEASRIFLVQGNTLRPVDPATGAAPWRVDLGAPPAWVGYLADRIIAATETRLVALGLDAGAIQWQYDLGAADPRHARGANPPWPGPSPSRRTPTPAGTGAPRETRASSRASGSSADASSASGASATIRRSSWAASSWRSTATRGWSTGRIRPPRG